MSRKRNLVQIETVSPESCRIARHAKHTNRVLIHFSPRLIYERIRFCLILVIYRHCQQCRRRRCRSNVVGACVSHVLCSAIYLYDCAFGYGSTGQFNFQCHQFTVVFSICRNVLVCATPFSTMCEFTLATYHTYASYCCTRLKLSNCSHGDGEMAEYFGIGQSVRAYLSIGVCTH